MKMKAGNIILGSVVALISFAIVVYAIETDKSMLQLFIGFAIFIIPITFIFSFQSAAAVFILVLCTALFSYGMYKFEYFDTLWGLLLAAVMGGSVAYFRTKKYKLFSPSRYKKKTAGMKEEN